MSYWGNDDDYRLPDPATIEYLVVDRQQVGEAQQQLLADLIDGDPYEVLFDQDDVVVAERVGVTRSALPGDGEEVLAERGMRHEALQGAADRHDHAVVAGRRHRAERLHVEQAVHRVVRRDAEHVEVADVDHLEPGRLDRCAARSPRR